MFFFLQVAYNSGLDEKHGSIRENMSTKPRCPWVSPNNIVYLNYHDNEWGRPLHDEHKLFEMLILEGAQAGLSWEIILNKRENYRKLFANFDPNKVARFTDKKIEKILLNPGVVRNRLKVYSAVNNAKQFLKIQSEFGSFDSFIWGFVDYKPIVNSFDTYSDYPTRTPLSDLISKELKKRGFKFVGSTIIYAFMQAIGMVDDHTTNCWVRLKKNEAWSVYMVLCDDDSIYTGIAKSVEKRFQEHCAQNHKTAKYLKGRGPLKLVYKEKIGTRSEALKIEHAVKKLSKSQKLLLIDQGHFDGI